MNGEKLAAIFKKRVAGVPVYVLAAVLALGLAFLAYRTKKLPAASTDTPAVGSNVTDGDPAGVVNPIFTANPVPTVSTADTSTAGNTASVDTNDAWMRRALAWLIGTKSIPEEQARPALERYLAGENLTVQQNSVKNLAVAEFGLPPDLPSGGGSIIPNAPFSGAAVRQGNPPITHKVKGTADNTTAELAKLYYGRTDADALNLIRAANISHAGDTYNVGQGVVIPRYQPAIWKIATRGMQTPDQFGAKNATSGARILALNPQVRSWPVPVGTRVRVR